MSEPREPRTVARMFGAIARRYDLLNHLLSANRDRAWRRAAARALPSACRGQILDLCGGTGDMALAVARQPGVGRVVCCDFAHPMLGLAREKFSRRAGGAQCSVIEADALRLPFADGAFDAVTVAFGVRNLASLEQGLAEMRRVLRPAGSLVVLEFSLPRARALRRLYGVYLDRVLPRIGDRLTGTDGAYAYLARTVAAFPPPAELSARIGEAGFVDCRWRSLSLGVLALHQATRPGPEQPVTRRRAAAAAAPSAHAGGFPPAGR